MKWWAQLTAVANDYFHRRWWRLIAATKSAHPDDFNAQIATLEKQLAALSASQIVKFELFYHEQRVKALQPEFWFVARIITSEFAECGFISLTGYLVLKF